MPLRKARTGEVVVMDVRPVNEYDQAHLPFARSMPLAKLRNRIADLLRDGVAEWAMAQQQVDQSSTA